MPITKKHLLEALYVTWGINKIDKDILNQTLNAKDHKIRAAAVKAVRYNMDKIDNAKEIFLKAAKDKHGRLVNHAVVTASWMNKADGLEILAAAKAHPSAKDSFNKRIYQKMLKLFLRVR